MTCFDMKEAFFISVVVVSEVNNIHQLVNSVHFIFDPIQYKIRLSFAVELKMFCRKSGKDSEGLDATQ